MLSSKACAIARNISTTMFWSVNHFFLRVKNRCQTNTICTRTIQRGITLHSLLVLAVYSTYRRDGVCLASFEIHEGYEKIEMIRFLLCLIRGEVL